MSTSASSVSFATGSPAPFSRPTFSHSLFFFAAAVPVEAFLVALSVSHQIQHQVGLPNTVLAYSGNVWILLSHLPLLPTLARFIFMSGFCKEHFLNLYISLVTFCLYSCL